MAEALLNELPKAHILVSKMTPMKGLRLGEIIGEGRLDAEAAEAFALIARRQISQDLMEEWIAYESPPLSRGRTCFSDFQK